MNAPVFRGVLLSALLALPVGAAETFDDYLAVLLTRNPSLREVESRSGAARSRVDYADGVPDPQFSVGRFGESVQTRTGPQETVVSLSQRFPGFGVRESRRSIAEAELASVEGRRDAIGLMLARELAELFYEYAFVGKATDLTRQNLELLRELEPVVESRVAAGDGLNSLLRLKVESGRLEDQLERLHSERIQLSAKLDRLLGVTSEEVRDWPGWTVPQAEGLDPQDEAGSWEDTNPALAAQRQRVEAARQRQRLVEREGRPDFAVGVNYIQVGDPEVNPDTPDAGADPWSVTASIRIPLWRGDEEARREEAERNLEGEQHRLEEVRDELRTALRVRAARLADARRRLELYGEELLDLARQAVENSRVGYENGSATLLELIDSERSQLKIEQDYWRAAADLRIHALHLRSLNVSDPESLLGESE